MADIFKDEKQGQGLTSPFGSKEARAQKDSNSGGVSSFVNAKGSQVMEDAADTNFGYTPKKGKKFAQ